jgi:hypothetical protein
MLTITAAWLSLMVSKVTLPQGRNVVDSVIAPLSYDEDAPAPVPDAGAVPLDALAADPGTRRAVASLLERAAVVPAIQQAFNSSI